MAKPRLILSCNVIICLFLLRSNQDARAGLDVNISCHYDLAVITVRVRHPYTYDCVIRNEVENFHQLFLREHDAPLG